MTARTLSSPLVRLSAPFFSRAGGERAQTYLIEAIFRGNCDGIATAF